MDIWDIALGFQDAQVLLTAQKLGVFDRLEQSPASAPEVAEAARLPEDSAARLLTALCALHLVDKRDGAFVNGPEASVQLVSGKPGFIGAMFPHVRDTLYPVWGHLEDALRRREAPWDVAFPNAPSPTEEMFDDPERLRAFLRGMHGITYAAASEFADYADELRGLRCLVDVGGAGGAFLIALAEKNPCLCGTVFDLPAVRPVAEEFIRDSGVADRVGFRAGDFWTDPLPKGANAYSLGFILHDWDRTGGDIILGKIRDAAPDGSLLILGEYLLNDEKTGPLCVARADLNMLVSAQGRERSAEEYARWLEHFGYRLQQIYQTSHAKHFLVFRKEGGAPDGRREEA
jgi:acetylserotonin N-methyltransferase